MSETIKRENLLGIGFITLAMAAFAVEDSLIKLLSTRLASGQILLMIGLGGTLGFFIWSHQKGEGVTAEMIRNPWVIGRTLSELVGTAFFVLSLALVPITTVSAIIQVSPLLVTLGAAVMLREKVGIRRWSAILVGLLGVAVILRPWSATFEASALLALMGVIGLSARDVATRRIAKSTPSLALATLGFGATIPAGLILLIFDPRLIVPTPTDSLLIVVSILIAIGGYYCIIAAMRIGDGQGDPQNRIGAQARFVGRAVHFDHGLVNCDLFIGFKANQRICNFSVHIFNRCQHSFAFIAIFIAIAQLNGFISTG